MARLHLQTVETHLAEQGAVVQRAARALELIGGDAARATARLSGELASSPLELRDLAQRVRTQALEAHRQGSILLEAAAALDAYGLVAEAVVREAPTAAAAGASRARPR